jgi:hypothetical protein
MSTSSLMAGPAAGRVAGEPRTAFVLAGGAALGAMQAGMVHALYERDIVPDLLIGTSAGALNAAFLASRPATTATVHELAALWRGLRRRDILPLRPATLVSGLAGRRDHLIPDRALRSHDKNPATAGTQPRPTAPPRRAAPGTTTTAPARPRNRGPCSATTGAGAPPATPQPARPSHTTHRPLSRCDPRPQAAPPGNRPRSPFLLLVAEIPWIRQQQR